MSISEKTIKILWGWSGCICAFPGCENELVYPDTNNVLGEISHIRSPNKKGPRFDPNFPENEFDEEKNLILFCPNHHTLIDKETDTYTIEKLIKIKEEHEKLIRNRLEVGHFARCTGWLGILNTFRTKYYFNIVELIPQIKLIKESLAIIS